ncbi:MULTISPECIES: ECF transporter S component [Lactobacillus]|uniref:ECF transporter S component n=1 Tax=Lactobacillus xujianguonis TaxID=2495899 RepID=A0A437SXN0_9LACO|nr:MULTISPECIES: ECF transporter S component [Lactobacillus]RVU71669.1 ECF transporter S component [Lactobacillus xujianguonis]RVU77680.1 ECF transporter S component [Lactobacillus xujianguonis]
MKRKETLNLTITALFAAILLLQTFVPNIGYVRLIPALPAITTIPLTIAIYASIMGPKSGLLFGLFWGITRLVLAYTQPGDMVSLMLFQNPLISLVPSILAGWFPGLIVNRMQQHKLSYVLSGLTTSLTNTVFVIGLTSLLFMNHAATLLRYLGNTSGSQSLLVVLVTALGFNGIVEAIFTAIVTPIIALPLNTILKRVAV